MKPADTASMSGPLKRKIPNTIWATPSMKTVQAMVLGMIESFKTGDGGEGK
jgi:hypothetical protein